MRPGKNTGEKIRGKKYGGKNEITLTIIRAFGVDDFGGGVLRTDETRELALVGLVGSLSTRFTHLGDDIEESSHGAVDAAFTLRNAAGRAGIFDPIIVE